MSPHGQPLKENQDRLMNIVFADEYAYLRVLYEDETPAATQPTPAAAGFAMAAAAPAAMASAAPFTRVHQEDQARKERVENTAGYKAREALIERAEAFISDGSTEAERLDQRLAESQVLRRPLIARSPAHRSLARSLACCRRRPVVSPSSTDSPRIPLLVVSTPTTSLLVVIHP